MAKSTKTPPKSDNITEFPASESSVAVEEPPEPRDTSAETPEPAPKTEQPPPKGPGRPKKTDESPQSDFFQQVAAVRPSDWGTRIYLYLYQLEPVCDLKKSGGKAYLMRYEEPITDEHRIMIEQGSGRYRFILAKNKISADASNELARYEFEIYNRLYPPKLNREAWVPDPRNRRWEVLLPKEPPPPPPAAAAETVLEGIRLGNELRKEAREEMKAEAPAAPAAAPAPVDPWAAAERILNMRSENPMVTILQTQMTSQAAALEAERERSFKAAEAAREREFKLQQDLIAARTAAAPAAQKSVLDQIMDFAADDAKLDRIKKVAGVFGFGMDGGGRAARTTPLDVMREVVNSPFGAQLGTGVSNLLTNLVSHTDAPNGIGVVQTLHPIPANGAGAPTNATHESETQRIQRIASAITNPMIGEFFDLDEPGNVFAERVFDFWPSDFLFLQHLGPDTIVNLYKDHNKPLWNYLTADPVKGNREAAFRKFITDFCAWSADEEPTTPADGFEEQQEKATV
jgi:hypothetical protein